MTRWREGKLNKRNFEKELCSFMFFFSLIFFLFFKRKGIGEQ